MYIDGYTLAAIMIALVSLMGALMYSIYVIRMMESTVNQMRSANTNLRKQNIRR